MATAAISGGTAMFGSGPPAKFMVLEGVGTFYPAGHPEEAVTLHGGDMVTLSADGHLVTAKFDVKAVMETSPLVTDFPDLANLPLILQVIDQQQTTQLNPGTTQPPLNDLVDVISVNTTSNPNITSTPGPSASPSPTAPPSKFGPLPTITSPNPYLITSGTQINTDPSITTNGATDFGKIYRGPALDGSEFDYLFGSTSAFDTTIGEFFNTNGNGVPVAVFKFSSLELTGNPTITIPSGATTFLGLVSVGDVTSGAPGGTLTGLDRLFVATVDGSITLGPEINFSGIGHVVFYARGSGSNLTLGSPISGADVVHLFAEGTVQVNGDMTVGTDFKSFSGGDFLAGTGTITAQNIDIESLSNLNINASQFPNPPTFGGSVNLNAANTLNLALNQPGHGGFGWDTLTAQATTINITGPSVTTFNFPNSSSVTFTAGTGGIQAPNIAFLGTNLTLMSGADINVGSIGDTMNGTDAALLISAATSFSASGVVEAKDLTAGTTVTTGGALVVSDTLTAGGNINVGDFLQATTINAPSSILTVQSEIAPNLTNAGAALQHTFNVDSIIVPNGGINFNGNPFDGANGLSSGGLLTVNANTLTFDSATGISSANFDGADAGAFSNGGPASGGDGGTFIVNASGNITANNGADISATTGNNASGDFGFSGAGGTVKLISAGGTIAVDDTIQVSSDDAPSDFPIRRSASGGTIDLQSNLTTGTGITVGANGQLLSLLDANAPGPGGSITLSTKGANIVVNGTVEADRGTITIDQNDPPGALITIDNATFIADTVNINAGGDLDIGLNNPVTISVGTISLSAPGSIQFDYASSLSLNEFDAATTGGDVNAQIGGSLALNGALSFTTNVSSGTTIASGAGVILNVNGDFTNDSLTNGTSFQVTNRGTIGRGGNISVSATGNLNFASAIANGTGASLQLFVDNSAGGIITTGGNATLNITGTAMLNGTFAEDIDNHGGSTITTGGNIIGQFGADVTETPGNFHSLNFFIDNGTLSANETGGTIGTGGNINLTFNGNVQTNGSATFGSFATGIFNEGGTITTGGNISVSVAGNLSCGNVLEGVIANDTGGTIGSGGGITFSIAGDVSDAGHALFEIDNYDGGSIGSNATINVSATSFSTAGNLTGDIENFGGGVIHGNATDMLNVSGDINATGSILLRIDDTGFDGPNNTIAGGIIDGSATVTLQGQNIITPSTASGTPGTDTMALEASIYTNVAGTVGGDAIINVSAAQNISAPGSVLFWVANGNYQNLGPGTIGGNAAVNVSAANISTGDFFFQILNYGGSSIGGNATLTLNVLSSLGINGSLNALIDNIGGTIGSGSVGDATINMNLTNDTNLAPTATVSGDANVQISGNDPAGSAAINFNGGSYSVGGTFLSTIDGNGTITFTNTDIHANIVKAGVFGANGSLIIGANAISANTLLQLYAPGSNGLLKFVANVTLSSGTELDLAASTITINPGVIVTIAGNGGAANVYTNNANYSGFGGSNGSNGTFAGNGANNPQPLANAPPFDPPSSTTSSSSSPGGTPKVGNQISSSGNVTSSSNATGSTMNVANSGQLLSLLNSATRGAGGKITLPVSNGQGSSHNSTKSSTGGRLKPNNDGLTAQVSAGKVTTGGQPAKLP